MSSVTSSSPVHAIDSRNSNESLADRLAWHNDGGEFADYPGPSWDAPRYEPTPEATAQEAGYELGYSRNLNAAPPADMPGALRLAWVTGYLDGMVRRRQDDAERAEFENEMRDWAFAEKDRHPSEVVQAIGIIAARQEGGAL